MNVRSKKSVTAYNNVFTLRGIRPSVARRKVGGVDSGDTSIHPTAVAAGRDRADARLEQLRVNGRREHGNVMRNC